MRAERGAATLPMLAVALILAALGALVGDVAVVMTARAQAMAAADAAALAAAPVTFASFGSGGGSPAAEAGRFATANGAVLVACECPVDRTWRPRTVRVVVAVPADLLLFGERSVAASSRADFVPTELPP